MLRINANMWSDIVCRVLERKDVETAAIILAEPMGSGRVLVARHVTFIPDDGYQIRKLDQIRIDPVVINRLVRPAREQRLSVLTVHSHPMASEAWFSQADDRGDARLLPAFAAQIPGVPHGSMVIAASGRFAARVLRNDGALHEVGLRVIGPQLDMLSSIPTDEHDARFARQLLALGPYGQGVLRSLCVGIVGLGGIGSVVAAQLAHLGIGKMVLVDGDKLEASNLSRVIGARSSDAGMMPKTAVARRYAGELGTPVVVECHERFISQSADLECLAMCDVIVSCVDRHTPRSLLNQLAYGALIPVIDLGAAFRVEASGAMIGAAGRVVIVGPGRPCLNCWGHIDPAALRREALSDAERTSEAADGYIDGADVPQPSVIAFNTMIAGAGVIELLRLVTGFAGVKDPPQRLALRFDEGDVRRNRLSVEPRCRTCGRAVNDDER